MAMRKKKMNRIKIKPVPIIILSTVVVFVLIALIFMLRDKPKEEPVKVSLKSVTDLGGDTNGNGESSTTSVKPISISIDMESCAIPIGTTIKITASVDPIETERTVNWRSSDENVFTVDSQGIITIKGKGTSALTATIGSSSDAIIIEGIENTDTAKSINNLPVFNLLTNQSVTSGGNSAKITSANQNSGAGSSNSSNTVQNSTDTGNATNNGGNSTNTDDSGNNSLDNGSTGGTNNSGNNNTSNTGNQTNSGLKSTDLTSNLPQIGYSQRMSNVYVYEENNTYYGEIIIQSNVTIIYIKQRSSGYDSKILEVLAKLLPTGSSQVWSNYLSATSDRTFTVDGRMIRIVTANNGGHSQIVIYN